MIIIGVDPGTMCTGYGIICLDRNRMSRLASGCISIGAATPVAERLGKIYDNLNIILKQYRPDEFALETAFYGKNVQSALKIGFARGVCMLAAIHNGIAVNEYSPREVKKSVVGNGSASKTQVQYMVTSILELDGNFSSMDESDALAIAICHAFRLQTPGFSHGRKKDWKAFVDANPDRVL